MAAGLVAALIGLAACQSTNVMQGDTAIRKSGDHLEVAVCRDADISSVLAEQRSWAWFGGWKSFWRGSGALHLSEGDILSTERLDGSLSGDFVEPELSGNFTILIRLADSDSVIASAFDSGLSGPPVDRWLHPDGQTSLRPCGD